MLLLLMYYFVFFISFDFSMSSIESIGHRLLTLFKSFKVFFFFFENLVAMLLLLSLMNKCIRMVLFTFIARNVDCISFHFNGSLSFRCYLLNSVFSQNYINIFFFVHSNSQSGVKRIIQIIFQFSC